VFAYINTSMVNTSIVLSSSLNVASIDAYESQKVNEELQGIKPPLDPLSLYNFELRLS
jgi:hypothetical protein